jgi:hypothetical protein
MDDNKFSGGWKGRRKARVRRVGLMQRLKEGAERQPDTDDRDLAEETAILRKGPILPLWDDAPKEKP